MKFQYDVYDDYDYSPDNEEMIKAWPLITSFFLCQVLLFHIVRYLLEYMLKIF